MRPGGIVNVVYMAYVLWFASSSFPNEDVICESKFVVAYNNLVQNIHTRKCQFHLKNS